MNSWLGEWGSDIYLFRGGQRASSRPLPKTLWVGPRLSRRQCKRHILINNFSYLLTRAFHPIQTLVYVSPDRGRIGLCKERVSKQKQFLANI
jgi:hypothetical protein